MASARPGPISTRADALVARRPVSPPVAPTGARNVTRARLSTSPGCVPATSQDGRSSPREDTVTRAARTTPRPTMAARSSCPAGPICMSRAAAAKGRSGPRWAAKALNSQPSPAPRTASACSHPKRARVLGSAQFARPLWTDARESTAMKGTCPVGSPARRRTTGDASTSLYGPTGVSRYRTNAPIVSGRRRRERSAGGSCASAAAVAR